MYRLWAKIITDNQMIKTLDVSINKKDEQLSLEEKREKCFDEIFNKLDVSVPLWLPKHANEFRQFKRVTFLKDDFVEDVDFDKFEIDLIDDGSSKHNKKSYL